MVHQLIFNAYNISIVKQHMHTTKSSYFKLIIRQLKRLSSKPTCLLTYGHKRGRWQCRDAACVALKMIPLLDILPQLVGTLWLWEY